MAEAFHGSLGIDGVVLTKLDGDARGGAALSVRAVTGVPIKFVGVGEHTDALEVFHPERMASRLLGMGDILSLVEKAEQTVDIERAAELEKKLRHDQFTLDDFKEQLSAIKGMGPLQDIVKMIPGVEFSATHQDTSIHILGYAFSLDNLDLNYFCSRHTLSVRKS